MKKSIIGLVYTLSLLPFSVEADNEEPQGFMIPLEIREESSVIDRHLKGESGFSNDRSDTIGGCLSCGS
ncbi:MAG: hypothetical protein K2X28_09150 [Alphaproteobacteria bacterium]|nr:hypothetical protein [Alphaproteobacteria bacterium]